MSKIKMTKNPCYCINIRRLSNVISRLYDEFLSQAGITLNQFSLLASLNKLETSSISELANYVGLDRTTLARSLKPLFERNLIEDISSAGQRRRVLQVTQLGKQAIKQGFPLWEMAQAEVEHRIGKERVEELKEVLTLLSES